MPHVLTDANEAVHGDEVRPHSFVLLLSKPLVMYIHLEVAFEVGGEGGYVFVFEHIHHPLQVDGEPVMGPQSLLKLLCMKGLHEGKQESSPGGEEET